MKPNLSWLIPVVLLAGAAFVAGEQARVKDLPERWQKWLKEEIYPVISDEERDAFLKLATDEQRQAFVERMWTIWGRRLDLGPKARLLYEERLEECRTEFENTTEDRARALLLHGPPDIKKEINCEEVFYPLEFWRWARIEGLGQGVTVLFYRPYGLGRYRLWDPAETRMAIYSTPGRMALSRPMTSKMDRPEWRCGDIDEILGLLAAAEFWLRDPRARAAMDHVVEEPGKEGVESASARFLEYSTLVPEGSQPLDFSASTSVTGRRGGLMRVAFSLVVPRKLLGSGKVGDLEVVQVDVTGEVTRESDMADRFRYAFTLPAEAAELPLQVERELRPGQYHLRLKVSDANSSRAGVREFDFEVIPPPSTRAADQGEAAKVVEQIARNGEPTLSLVGPEGEGVTGIQRFTALTGPGVARVEFFLDGRPVLSKNRPPFEVELDLGPLPRLAAITAVAFDAAGAELDRKRLDLNVGRERFMVRLQPVGQADRSGDRVKVRVDLNVPPDRKLARMELYWNEMLFATLYQPPFETWLVVPDPTGLGYLRALAVLDDGGQAEDVQFVNAPTFLTGVKVETVELPVVVVDHAGKPVQGLEETEFEVLEDGVPQQISHFSHEQEMPIRLGLVLDTSGSMEKTLPEVQRVVLGFLHNLLRPKDRAFVVAFSDQPSLLEGFTADFQALERALIALRADRETALYDAVIYGLFQFSGVRGRKCLITLTDGKDNASRMDFDRAMDYAQRSGVTVYTIGIDLPITEIRTRSQLTKLAQITGGDSVFLSRDAKLQPVYDRINRELRSQYLLAYTSSSDAPADKFRNVTVRVKRTGVEVRTIAGYYPGS